MFSVGARGCLASKRVTAAAAGVGSSPMAPVTYCESRFPEKAFSFIVSLSQIGTRISTGKTKHTVAGLAKAGHWKRPQQERFMRMHGLISTRFLFAICKSLAH
jgi:hypothetical protein